jgi:ABC-2 type transport system permease protein
VSRRTLVLAVHSIVRLRGVLIAVAASLGVFQFLLTQVAGYLSRQSAFAGLSALMPDFVRTVAGPSALAFMSFTGIVSLGYFHPIVLSTLVGLMIAIATEPAAEVETRFVDLTLARPLRRVEVISRTVIVIAFTGVAMLASMMAGTWSGLACCAPPGAEALPFTLTLSLAATLAAVLACWAGIALALATIARRRASAGAIAGVAAFASYLLDYLGRAWDPARPISVISPFHYFEPMPLIAGQAFNAGNAIVLAAISVTAVTAAYIAFNRRDI